MRITHSKDLSLPEYYLSDKKLEVTDKFKDLGIMMTHNLAWSSHVYTIASKANQMLGLDKRTVGSSNLATFTLLYKALVRPILEYSAPVWSPHLSKDIKALESVQRRASQIALQQKQGEMSYPDRCDLL